MAEDDLLVQIETDKVTIDVRYQQKEPGIVKEFLVKMDDTVQVRLPLAWYCGQLQVQQRLCRLVHEHSQWLQS